MKVGLGGVAVCTLFNDNGICLELAFSHYCLKLYVLP